MRPRVDEWEIAYLHRDHRVAGGCSARVTWAEGDPTKIDSILDAFRMGIMPRVEQLEGFCSASLFVDRMSGRCCVTATYDSPEAMVATRDAAMGLRADLVQDTGMRITEIGEFTLAIAHLDAPGSSGSSGLVRAALVDGGEQHADAHEESAEDAVQGALARLSLGQPPEPACRRGEEEPHDDDVDGDDRRGEHGVLRDQRPVRAGRTAV